MADLILRVAAKALIVNDEGKVLLLREADTYEEGTNLGKYQIPGGRLNPGESYEDAMYREVYEETGLKVDILYPIYVGEWRPVIKGVPHQIIAIFTVCKVKSTDVKLSEEHDDFKWVDPANMGNINTTDPDPEVLARYAEWQTRKLPA